MQLSCCGKRRLYASGAAILAYCQRNGEERRPETGVAELEPEHAWLSDEPDPLHSRGTRRDTERMRSSRRRATDKSGARRIVLWVKSVGGVSELEVGARPTGRGQLPPERREGDGNKATPPPRKVAELCTSPFLQLAHVATLSPFA